MEAIVIESQEHSELTNSIDALLELTLSELALVGGGDSGETFVQIA